MAVRELSDKRPDGTRLGQSSADLVGFFGEAPVAQPSGASQAAVTLTAVTALGTTATITTAAHGYATGTQADKVAVRVNQLIVDVTAQNVLITKLRANLVTLGLIAGS